MKIYINTRARASAPEIARHNNTSYKHIHTHTHMHTRLDNETVAMSKVGKRSGAVPKAGPAPTLISRKEVDMLYETVEAVISGLDQLGVDYILTGGSMLGCIRQHSILFCDDDIDLAIIEKSCGDETYKFVRENLQGVLGTEFQYKVGDFCDRVRKKHCPVFLDLFTLRRYNNMKELRDLISVKKNGKPQPENYVQNILDKMYSCAFNQGENSSLFPLWQFSTRKAIELWPKEVYREHELFPLSELKFGPLEKVKGPRQPVRLLKRAFGKDCFEVYYQSCSHKLASKQTNKRNTNGENQPLEPIVLGGGTWESKERLQLKDEHYLPMQPTPRSKRRHTLHCKEALFAYLEEQEGFEQQWSSEHFLSSISSKQSKKKKTVYLDGVFDVFHLGHLKAIRQCAKLGDRVIIGITGDKDATSYKRRPIIREAERVEIVRAIREVDEIVCPCPLVVTEEFMESYGIDLVVHGFANDEDAKKQEKFFEIPASLGKFQRIGYYKGQSTSDIIANIKQNVKPKEQPNKAKETSSAKPTWFGAAMASVAGNFIQTSPFPLNLRIVAEPHIAKARKRRKDALGQLCEETGEVQFKEMISSFKSSKLIQESDFTFDCKKYQLRSFFLSSAGLPENLNLRSLHTVKGAKMKALQSITKNFKGFQKCFDEFVRSVCAPRMDSLFSCEEIWYQAFPCIRIIQPDEFSIGPHSDCAYGHHPCGINFYVPLTEINCTSSLFLESNMGSEDWHPIVGSYGTVKHFAGAICLHWTSENKTGKTRVSLDFRLIPGKFYNGLKNGGKTYREGNGYYAVCRKVKSETGVSSWVRDGSKMPKPDARCGFPWTVKESKMNKLVNK